MEGRKVELIVVEWSGRLESGVEGRKAEWNVGKRSGM